MTSLYVLTTEEKGDGSGNFADFYRPAISIFDSKEEVYNAIFKYLEIIDKQYADNFKKNCSNKNTVYDHIISNNGFIINSGPPKQLRIKKTKLNEFNEGGYYWEMKNNKTYNELIEEKAKWKNEVEIPEKLEVTKLNTINLPRKVY